MPFVKRDAAGRIAAVYGEPEEDGLESIDAASPELVAFLGKGGNPEDAIRRSFHDADAGFIRVLEDLIDVLIQRGYIQFADFPDAAQRKLNERRGLRREYAYLQSLFGDGSDDYSGGGGHGGGWFR
ncbi:MAG: hypothetical protein H7841_15420 [Magnetospirillum sp. WYHS-4]